MDFEEFLCNILITEGRIKDIISWVQFLIMCDTEKKHLNTTTRGIRFVLYCGNLFWSPLRRHLGIFHYRAQDRVSFTARLTSLILQQYKIGFKVELKDIKSAVVVNALINTGEGLFWISRKANDTNKRKGE